MSAPQCDRQAWCGPSPSGIWAKAAVWGGGNRAMDGGTELKGPTGSEVGTGRPAHRETCHRMDGAALGGNPAPGPLSRGSSSLAHFLGKENLKPERGWPDEVKGVASAPPTSAPPGIVSLTRSEARGAHQNHEASIPRKPSSIKVQTAGGARWPGRGCSHESEDGPRSSPSQRSQQSQGPGNQ